MEAALWPVGVRGVLSHHTALDSIHVCDVNPNEVHISVPRGRRPQRPGAPFERLKGRFVILEQLMRDPRLGLTQEGDQGGVWTVDGH